MPALRVLSLNTERGWRGGENQCYLLQRGMVERGGDDIALRSACLAGEPLALRLEQEGLPCLPLPHGRLRIIRRLRALLRAGEVDLLHAQASHAHSLGNLAVLGKRCPLLVTRRVDFAVGRSRLSAWKYRRADGYAAISEAVAVVLRAAGVDPERITVIPSGIDPARFAVAPAAALRGELRIPEQARIVSCVAALTAHKGHRYLLDAWRTVEAQQADAHLLLIGEGELEDELRAQAAAVGLQRLHFLGRRDDVPALLRVSDAFVLASIEEGLGTSLMDALCCGLPVVATRAGGIVELIEDGRSGLLVPPADAQSLAAALLRLLDDAELRDALARAGSAQSERFHYRHMVAAYARHYPTLSAR